MGRRSKVRRLPADVRKWIESALRADKLSLDELIAELQERFPSADLPSRSGLHRYAQSFTELTARMREIETVSNAVVGELGEGVGEKAGALLAQAVTTLVTNAALNAHVAEDAPSIEEIRKLARAAKDAIDTRRISLAERQAIAKAAAERALKESRDRVEALGADGAIPPEILNRVVKAAYGLDA